MKGESANKWSVQYAAYLQGEGDTATVKDGEFIGNRSPKNLARGKRTTQSSNYSSRDGLSQVGADGNINPSWGGRSVTHTGNQNKSWWEVDLEDKFTIGVVNVYNRQDCCAYRFDNF